MADNKTLDLTLWQRLNTLLDHGLALDPKERDSWLATLPPDYADLGATLRSMLAERSVETSSFLSRPVAVQELIGRTEASELDVPGADVGPYRLIRRLGAGGMGTVWLADRMDGALTRRVALKLPLHSWAPGLSERMSRERDILASLEHRHIARLYDAGVTAEGRPYMALEYVNGEAIDVYCRTQRLSVKEKLRIVLQVTDAIAHAHAQLVVHRDIKPGNILVTPDGDVRLLDFGVAKLLTGDNINGASSDTRLTRMAGAALTLDYASPEQIKAQRITVASDVYSLGVVLFELLTGKRPYRLKRDSAGALEDAITEQDVPLASYVCDKQIRRAIRGDLDTIIAKALKKSVAERYPSIEAFAADIKRFLASQPVAAQKDSQWYRGKKFLSRNAGKVATGGIAITAIILAGGLAGWQATVARDEANRALATKNFIASLFTSATPRTGVGGEVTASDLLSAAIPRIEAEFASNPAIAGELGVVIAEAFDELGETDKMDAPLGLAIPRVERAYGPSHPLVIRGKLVHVQSLKFADPEKALVLLDEIIPIALAALPEMATQAVYGLVEKSFLLARKDLQEPSYAALKQAIAVGETHLGVQHERTVYAMGLLSNTYGRFGDRVRELATIQEAHRRAEAAFSSQRPHGILTAVERWYADALRASGRPADAVPWFRRVLEDQLKLDTVNTQRVRHAKFFLARALDAAGQSKAALPAMREVLEIAEKQVGEFSEDRGVYLNTYAAVLNNARLGAEALPYQKLANEIADKSKADLERIRIPYTLNTARALMLSGDFDGAETELKPLVDNATLKVEVQAAVMFARAFNARLHDDSAGAISMLSEVYAAPTYGQLSTSTKASIVSTLGIAYLDTAQFDKADSILTVCRALFEAAQIDLSVRAHECLIGNARMSIRLGRPTDAEQLLARLAQDWSEVNANSGWHGEALHWLARAQSQVGKMDEARRNFALAMPMLRGSKLRLHQQLK